MYDWISTFPGYQNILTTAKKAFGRIIQTGPTPKHVGIIMDGNRRYAKVHNIEVKEGHNMGFESMGSILELLYESGVQSVTVYAFSIENFKRSKYEVASLMDLFRSKFKQISQHKELCQSYGVRIKVLGSTHLLPADVQKTLKETEEMTKNNTRATLNVCIPYTSREEITTSIKRVVEESVKTPELVIDERTLENKLYTADSPPLDLLVRTSGTNRLSDFLLWQSVSSTCSVVFVKQYWPEFRSWDMCKVLIKWGFNTYWYGHGNGHSPTTRLENPTEDFPMQTISGSGTTGFSRFGDDDEYDDEDEYDEDSSDAVGQEMDTAASEEDSISGKRS